MTRAPEEILREVFGHERFRPHQAEVCRSACGGDDVLLVMPTGAGKSLCYQLPGLARPGTAIVISPLIALMEDQVEKLQALGLLADRIHSGRSRLDSRAVCRSYLDGTLDFLFIAPERLSVPGFIEMLAKRTPSMVAIDEAHCISHWGHDFRPDYRMLGGRIAALRPAPVIALTATATPRVQDDIIRQLELPNAKRFIHGFRRDNIAIEIVETSKPDRLGVVTRLLADAQRRPAILYAPSRKESEAIAGSLSSRFSAAAYHAGMPPAAREEVQTRFMGGQLEVVVATIAFGMGVDKGDIRTVAHLALPSSLEGYYQEIGRAGRDGLPSRAVLLHSYADRRLHEFFHDRDYPAPGALEQIVSALAKQSLPKEELASRTRLEEDAFDSALEKLWIHGGVKIDPDETVHPGHGRWRAAYEAQRDHRRSQLDDMDRFTRAHGCRMVHLVHHFGDAEDDGSPCGLCDVCAHEESTLQSFRDPHPPEVAVLASILDALRASGARGSGSLFKEAVEGPGRTMARDNFESLIASLSRASFVRVSEDSFDKDGRTIRYQKVSLTPRGRSAMPAHLQKLPVRELFRGSTSRKKKRRAKASAGALPDAPESLIRAFKEWRLSEAKRRKIPAFRIMPNRVLERIASTRPASLDELGEISGVGPVLVEKYGRDILGLLRTQ